MKIILLPFEVESWAIGVLYNKLQSDGHDVLIVNCDTWMYNDYHGRRNILNWYKELNIDTYRTLESIHGQFLKKNCDNIDYNFLEEFEKKYCKSKNLMQLILTDHIFGHGFRYPYYVKFSNNKKIKWVELQLKWIEGIVNEFCPELIFTIERNYFIKNAFWQIAQSKNIKMYTLVQGRVQSKFFISENFGYGNDLKVEDLLCKYTQEQLVQARDYVTSYFENDEFSVYNTSATEKLLKGKSFSAKKIIYELVWSIYFEVKHFIISWKHVWKLFKPVLGDYSETKAIYYQLRRFFNKMRYFVLNKHDFNQSLPNKPFIYFALHALPESSTLTLSSEYYEEDLIRYISKEMPIDLLLVVKENPLMVGDRPYNFYSQLKNNLNVYLIDPLYSSKGIIKHARGTAGISGTVLLETAMLNKPTLSFGEPDFKNVITYTGHSGVTAFIKDCLEEKPSEKYDQTLRYLQYIIENGVVLPWLDVLYRPKSKSFIDGVNSIYNLLKKRLPSVCIGSSRKGILS